MSSYTHVVFSLFNIKSFDHHRHKIPPHWTNMTEKAMTAVTSSQQRIMAKTFSTDKGTKGHHQYQKSAEMHDEINRRREVDSRQ